MTNGIVYCVGASYIVRMLVSLWSMRKSAFWKGDIRIFTISPRSHPIGPHIKNDSRLGVSWAKLDAVEQGYGGALVTKTLTFFESPFDTTLFLDADTVIRDQIEEIFSNPCGIALTQFSNWTTNRTEVKSNLLKWRGISKAIDAMVERSLSRDDPAINTGVFLFRRGNPDLGLWHKLAMQGVNLAVADEVAIQLLLADLSDFALLDDSWNLSTLHGIHRENARIWHFHGESHRRTIPEAKTWCDLLREVWDNNIAGIQAWGPTLNDEDLSRLLQGMRGT